MLSVLIRTAILMSTHNIHFPDKTGKIPKISLNIWAQLFKADNIVS